ncbi:MAG: winged helix-turn-helix transcriptional regulator [Rhodospirillales bacterium]|nr:winged helix-turn-helix transcriptional regulator [Rhodospirillales bacterium]
MNTEARATDLDLSGPSNGRAEDEITLGLLNAIEGNSAVTQRSLARDLGIALGLANAYLKRCVTKGLVKVATAPANRYVYYLTPKGFSEKSKLTGEYLAQSFRFFRSARDQVAAILKDCDERGFRRIALFGAGDLAEIVTLCARDFWIELVGIVDGQVAEPEAAQLRVVKSLAELGPIDAAVVTSLESPQGAFDAARAVVPMERIFAPALLKISRQRPVLVAEA